MLENALILKNISIKKRISIKALTVLLIVVLAVALPQIVHIVLGKAGGVEYLPMYLPVLLGGCLLGVEWGMAAGILSPVVSFLLTSLMGNPMPVAVRLPFMMAELAVFAGVSGLFSKKIFKNGLWAFLAVLSAQVAGRLVFLGLVAIFKKYVPFTPAIILSQIKAGIPGILIQLAVVPALVILIRKFMLADEGK